MSSPRFGHVILNGKGFVLSRLANQVEILGHECGELIQMGADIGQQLLDGGTELRKGRIVGIAGDLLSKELPEALDQIQVGSVGRQKQEVNAQLLGHRLDRARPLV